MLTDKHDDSKQQSGGMGESGDVFSVPDCDSTSIPAVFLPNASNHVVLGIN